MEKLLVVLLSGMLVFSLVGCGSKSEPEPESELEMSEGEYKTSCMDVTWSELFENEEEYTNKNIHIRFVFLQGMYEEPDYFSFGAVAEDGGDLLVDIPTDIEVDSNETVDIWGQYKGISNESMGMSSSHESPWIIAKYVEKSKDSSNYPASR